MKSTTFILQNKKNFNKINERKIVNSSIRTAVANLNFGKKNFCNIIKRPGIDSLKKAGIPKVNAVGQTNESYPRTVGQISDVYWQQNMKCNTNQRMMLNCLKKENLNFKDFNDFASKLDSNKLLATNVFKEYLDIWDVVILDFSKINYKHISILKESIMTHPCVLTHNKNTGRILLQTLSHAQNKSLSNETMSMKSKLIKTKKFLDLNNSYVAHETRFISHADLVGDPKDQYLWLTTYEFLDKKEIMQSTVVLKPAYEQFLFDNIYHFMHNAMELEVTKNGAQGVLQINNTGIVHKLPEKQAISSCFSHYEKIKDEI